MNTPKLPFRVAIALILTVLLTACSVSPTPTPISTAKTPQNLQERLDALKGKWAGRIRASWGMGHAGPERFIEILAVHPNLNRVYLVYSTRFGGAWHNAELEFFDEMISIRFMSIANSRVTLFLSKDGKILSGDIKMRGSEAPPFQIELFKQ